MEVREARAVYKIDQNAYQAIATSGLLPKRVELVDGVVVQKGSLRNHLWTRSDYHSLAEQRLLPERLIELNDGVIYHRSPQGSKHAIAIAKINRLLLKNLPEQFVVFPQTSYVVNNYTELEPDFSVVRQDLEAMDTLPSEAELIIEVSDSSLEFDQGAKLAIYATAGVPEYWIVNLRDRQLEIHRGPESSAYRERIVVRESEETTLPSGKAGKISVADMLP